MFINAATGRCITSSDRNWSVLAYMYHDYRKPVELRVKADSTGKLMICPWSALIELLLRALSIDIMSAVNTCCVTAAMLSFTLCLLSTLVELLLTLLSIDIMSAVNTCCVTADSVVY